MYYDVEITKFNGSMACITIKKTKVTRDRRLKKNINIRYNTIHTGR